MLRKTLTACAALLLAAVLHAQKTPDSATMMKNWTNYMTPGKEHAMMASWNGTWTGDIKMWSAPGQPPMTSTGTANNTMVLGGRYQLSNYTGSFMGQPFEGMSTLAFDNAKKIFISSWMDNMGTGVMYATGRWNQATKSITFTGRMVDPTTFKEVPFREVFRIIDNDHQVMEMYNAGPNGKEFKSMQIDYTRQK